MRIPHLLSYAHTPPRGPLAIAAFALAAGALLPLGDTATATTAP
ncbi:hypothetical protein [Streptomyces sp. H27-D2]|nr:hypothetical protein [Streptomyces sp. H27-D2]MEC4018655.1 hypothetical protein [Streptomyces sp. H27-D2]